MTKKKALYIILAVLAVILVAVIVVAAIKLNSKPAAGGQTGADATTSTIATTVDNAEETTANTPSQSTENNAVGWGEGDNVVQEPEVTIEPAKEDITGIDFDDLLD